MSRQPEVPDRGGLGTADPEFRACSACAGDYEDPERTAWVADDSAKAGDDGDAAGVGDREEFPDSEE